MTIAIIQARLGSSRLKNKILKDLCGHPVLWHVASRVKKAKKIDKIIIATTEETLDDETEKFCFENGLFFFRGSSEDVLQRFYQLAKSENADTIVRLTGDCPLIDPSVIDLNVNQFLAGDYDYMSTVRPGPSTFPRGLDTEVFNFKSLEKAHLESKEKFEREHVTPFIWQNKNNIFKIGPMVLALGNYKRPSYRLTLDYPEDLHLMEEIYRKFYKEGEIIDVSEVLMWLDNNPDKVLINAHRELEHLEREAVSVGKRESARRYNN